MGMIFAFEMADLPFMRRALELAAGTAGMASPNPQVGCVLVRDGVVLGEGAHGYDAYDHAEIVALKQAAARGFEVAGATAYVTLEPCSHHGRTGPCADALIAADVDRVVVATVDPNPLVAGRGIARLRRAGMQMRVGLFEGLAREMNDGFAHFIRTGRPLVTLKAALSVDGMLAPAARAGTGPVWLTGEAARAEVQRLRHGVDAILTGVGTVLADDPALTDRTGSARRRRLLRVVLDAHVRTPITAHIVASALEDVLIFCGPSADQGKAAALQGAGAEVKMVGADGGGLRLDEVLAELGRRKILSLLVEGGSAVHGSFLARDLVDKVVLFYSETELGPSAIPFAAGQESAYLLQRRLERVTRKAFAHGVTEDACVMGYLHDPWLAVPAV